MFSIVGRLNILREHKNSTRSFKHVVTFRRTYTVESTRSVNLNRGCFQVLYSFTWARTGLIQARIVVCGSLDSGRLLYCMLYVICVALMIIRMLSVPVGVT